MIYLVLLLSLLPLVAAENIYQQDALQLQLEVDGQIQLTAEQSGAELKEVTAKLFLYPLEDYRQELLNLKTTGQSQDSYLLFKWQDQRIENKDFGYTAMIETNNLRQKVKTKITFPIAESKVSQYQQYLQPTITIDSDHPKIVQTATELAEGEDDLFKVVFNLADWVETNVEYDLNSVTSSASQQASWVLENKEGVCDEISTLFIAMCRTLGIPARFASGISYTNSEEFTDRWQPHGWAEVYFPDVGWVSFDPTFGEYGYIDVTHIKLRDSLDPAEAATKYEWLASHVKLETEPLDFNVLIKQQGQYVPEEVLLEQEVLSSETGYGSYNLVRGILKNQADYYAATTLRLAAPAEIEIIGANRRTIMLHPKEVRETYWLIKVDENLNDHYLYAFPLLIYTEKNVSVRDSFTAKKEATIYTKEEIEKLIVNDEEKSYSRRVSFHCNYSSETKVDVPIRISCTVKNSGNTNLQQLNFCLDQSCKVVNLPINQEQTTEIVWFAPQAGWHKIIISAENELVEKKSSLELVAYDQPALNLSVQYSNTATLNQTLLFQMKLQKNSFSIPQNVTIDFNGPGFVNQWELSELDDEELLELELADYRLSRQNRFKINIQWLDQQGQTYQTQQELMVSGQARNFKEKIKLFWNGLINFIL